MPREAAFCAPPEGLGRERARGAASPFAACGPRHVARHRPFFSVSHTRAGIRQHGIAHKGGIKPLCAAGVS